MRASRYGRLRAGLERKRAQLGRLSRRRIEGLLRDDARLNVLDLGRRERPAVVVVDVEPEDACRGMHALEVMPVVRRHEELAAVLRVVIAVRAQRPASDARRAVGAGARLEMLGGAIGRARPRERHGDRHQLAPAHAALAGIGFGDRRVHWTHPCRVETHGHERQLAVGARTGLRLEDVRMVNARHRDRRQRRRPRPACGRCAATAVVIASADDRRREEGFHGRRLSIIP